MSFWQAVREVNAAFALLVSDAVHPVDCAVKRKEQCDAIKLRTWVRFPSPAP